MLIRRSFFNVAALRSYLWLLFLSLMALNCLATSLSLVGSGSYNISGNTVVLRADQAQNNEFGGRNGTIRWGNHYRLPFRFLTT